MDRTQQSLAWDVGLAAADATSSGYQRWSFYHDAVWLALMSGGLEEARELARTASELAAMIWVDILGWDSAIRVTSRRPCPASFRCSSGTSLSRDAVSVLISGLSTDMNNKRSARAVLENLASTNNFAEVVDLTLAP